jgi:quercetin dioxygenase-like cupin family protein
MNGIATSANVGCAWFADEMLDAVETAPAESLATVLLERRARRGTMSPLHRRDESETFRVLSGIVTFYIGADVVTARRGDVVVAPAGVARTARPDTGDARWLVLTRVASLDRYLDFGRAFAPPVPEAELTPQDMATLGAIAAVNGIELLGPPGALPDGP